LPLLRPRSLRQAWEIDAMLGEVIRQRDARCASTQNATRKQLSLTWLRLLPFIWSAIPQPGRSSTVRPLLFPFHIRERPTIAEPQSLSTGPNDILLAFRLSLRRQRPCRICLIQHGGALCLVARLGAWTPLRRPLGLASHITSALDDRAMRSRVCYLRPVTMEVVDGLKGWEKLEMT
jgi:hypothetical protein